MPKQAPKVDGQSRPIKFPKIDVQMKVINEELMKTILGWVELENAKDMVKMDDYTLVDDEGKKVKCVNNANNRPFAEDWARTLRQIFLKKQYKFNGETIIVGETGLVLSAQHRGIGFVLACQAWRKAKNLQLAEQDLNEEQKQILEYWPDTAPTFESLIVFGVKEDEATVSTLDNTRPRDFSDVLYTSGVFGKMSPVKRQKLSKLTGNAVKLLWERTGMKKDAFSSYLTNAEMTEFVNNHSRLIGCVKHIFNTDIKNQGEKAGCISRWYGPGSASGLMYLMACSQTQPDDYQQHTPRSEKYLTWTKEGEFVQTENGVDKSRLDKNGMYKKAEEFWTLFSISGTQKTPIQPLFEAMKQIAVASPNGHASEKEKRALIVKVWNAWINGETIVYDPANVGLQGNIALEYLADEHGDLHLNETPLVGGIDHIPQAEEEEALTPEQLAEMEKIKEENQTKKRKERQEKANKANEPKETPEQILERKKKEGTLVTPKPQGVDSKSPKPAPKPTENGKKPTPTKTPLKGGL